MSNSKFDKSKPYCKCVPGYISDAVCDIDGKISFRLNNKTFNYEYGKDGNVYLFRNEPILSNIKLCVTVDKFETYFKVITRPKDNNIETFNILISKIRRSK